MMKENPHDIFKMEELEKMTKDSVQEVEDIAVPIPDDELAKVKRMNRRARKRWLESKGVKLSEFKKL